ncbi:signal peptidase I [Frankia casuarinae]|uniref:Signal peptidase I n=1 Tax=Frankia casuarinae (strain DSM 45818 / CECT 9043 / HFP020203 / CcI3) TaxID=106370 RepID=Q2J701_FRACC|nr:MULTISPECIES: signal peptidase I [Frankia]ABD12941.1 signal peptidase I. Serine peptidase. MEROPS family S26A [Frankia casuarinae]ETA03544.1 signal peptidase I [Frankia sp. CcI6]EYT93505.1 signal peptidase I [Frankia casuarinae]KDA43732.1 signal peptidase I [Frankia sp. BMG5.23]KEZ36179.1 signal peptidase I [Frankia sp. CeD]
MNASDPSGPRVPGRTDGGQPDGAWPSPAAEPDGPKDQAQPDGPEATGRRVSRPEAARTRGRGSFLRELPVLVLIAFLLALLIKAFLVQAFWIPSESMERTLLVDDRVLVNKVVYHFRDVHRGEIVVFNGKGTGFDHAESVVPPPSNAFSRFVRGAQNLLGLGAPSETDFIKRVIAVGGDTVACCDTAGRVSVNGHPLDEPYVYQNDYQRFGPLTVPAGYLWVMGDHRGASSDARQNGPIPKHAVVGRAFVRVWPLGRFGFLGVPNDFAGIPAASVLPPAPRASAGSTTSAALSSTGDAVVPLPGYPATDDVSLFALAVLIPPAWTATRRPRRMPRGSTRTRAPGTARRRGPS